MAQRFRKSYETHAGSEIGTIRKNWKGRLHIALVYPNTYYVGMSNLGFQTVYHQLNAMEGVVCERAFLPGKKDFAADRIITVESGRVISDFDIIAFSVSFESDYLNLVGIIEKAGIPLQSSDRIPPVPLVIAGGVACFLNPEPIAPFIDCFLIGEAEKMLPLFIDTIEPHDDRKKILKSLAVNIPGVYVPSFYQPGYNEDGTLCDFEPVEGLPDKIDRVVLDHLSDTTTCTAVLTPDTAFDRTFLIEVSRGCPHGCRFCAAGYVYRPPRFRPYSKIKADMDLGASVTQRVGLVGAAITDLAEIKNLCDHADNNDLRVSFSSLRADALTSDLIVALKQSRVKTATIAPDAGSCRMRRIINKSIKEADILHAAEALVSGGIPNLKLYFMVGLPEETEDDVEEIVKLCKKIKSVFLSAARARKHIGNITVSINPFIPKPFTPFQWVGMDSVALLNKKIKMIRQGLKRIPNVRVHAENPSRTYVQALLSRGDRKVAGLLTRALLNKGNWLKTYKESKIDPDFYVLRTRNIDERLPWDFINHGISKDFLIKEYHRAKAGKRSGPCPMTSCDICGVCGKVSDNNG